MLMCANQMVGAVAHDQHAISWRKYLSKSIDPVCPNAKMFHRKSCVNPQEQMNTCAIDGLKTRLAETQTAIRANRAQLKTLLADRGTLLAALRSFGSRQAGGRGVRFWGVLAGHS
jgi:hypothetical protein